MWCAAEFTPAYIAKMEDVHALYEKPYDPKEPVVCLDERPVSLNADVVPHVQTIVTAYASAQTMYLVMDDLN